METKAKHTPGPWQIDADRPTIITDCKHNPRNLANCGNKTNTQACANARLIAAAPDLLAELTAYHDREWMEPHEKLPHHSAGEYPKECSGCAAVASATGGASC